MVCHDKGFLKNNNPKATKFHPHDNVIMIGLFTKQFRVTKLKKFQAKKNDQVSIWLVLNLFND